MKGRCCWQYRLDGPVSLYLLPALPSCLLISSSPAKPGDGTTTTSLHAIPQVPSPYHHWRHRLPARLWLYGPHETTVNKARGPETTARFCQLTEAWPRSAAQPTLWRVAIRLRCVSHSLLHCNQLPEFAWLRPIGLYCCFRAATCLQPSLLQTTLATLIEEYGLYYRLSGFKAITYPLVRSICRFLFADHVTELDFLCECTSLVLSLLTSHCCNLYTLTILVT